MYQVMDGIRRLLIQQLATSYPLTFDSPVGSQAVFIANTSRFKVGDTVCLSVPQTDPPTATGEFVEVVGIPEYNELTVTPTVGSWTAASGAMVTKAIGKRLLKGVFIGDLRQLPDFPCITISPTSEDNEWFTLRGTSHDYKMTIRTYAETSTAEDSEWLLSVLSEYIRETLIDHIHPLINGTQVPLTADWLTGNAIITVADTTPFRKSKTGALFIRDANVLPFATQENGIKSILSDTQVEMYICAPTDFLVARQAEAVLFDRYLYDTRPSSITYGSVPGKSSFLRASEISYYGKEFISRPYGAILT